MVGLGMERTVGAPFFVSRGGIKNTIISGETNSTGGDYEP